MQAASFSIPKAAISSAQRICGRCVMSNAPLSAGRGSRLSQILQYTEEIVGAGVAYDDEAGPPDELDALSILGIGDLANALLKRHAGLAIARDRLNDEYLKKLSFAGSALAGDIGVAAGDDFARLRQLLEKFELQLTEAGADHLPRNRGLGSNNLLFMACELLLLAQRKMVFPSCLSKSLRHTYIRSASFV